VKRRLLNLVALLSSLISVALAAPWVRSYFARDYVSRAYVPKPHRHAFALHASFNRGIARLARQDVKYGGEWRGSGDLGTFVTRGPPRYSLKPRRPDTAAERYLVAFSYRDQTAPTPLPGMTERVRTLVLPLWAGVVLFAAPPAVLFRRRLRALRHARRGLCARCGYDLRETPECCPECGLPVAV